MVKKRPDVLRGETVKIPVGCGNLYVILNHLDDDRFNVPPLNEVWIEPGFKAKDEDDITTYCVKSFLIPIARLITFIVRRISEEERGDFIRQIHKHECPKRSVATAKSCVDGIARAIICYWDGHKIKEGRCWICGRTDFKEEQ